MFTPPERCPSKDFCEVAGCRAPTLCAVAQVLATTPEPIPLEAIPDLTGVERRLVSLHNGIERLFGRRKQGVGFAEPPLLLTQAEEAPTVTDVSKFSMTPEQPAFIPAPPPVVPGQAVATRLPSEALLVPMAFGGFLLVIDKKPMGAALTPDQIGPLVQAWSRGDFG